MREYRVWLTSSGAFYAPNGVMLCTPHKCVATAEAQRLTDLNRPAVAVTRSGGLSVNL